MKLLVMRCLWSHVVCTHGETLLSTCAPNIALPLFISLFVFFIISVLLFSWRVQKGYENRLQLKTYLIGSWHWALKLLEFSDKLQAPYFKNAFRIVNGDFSFFNFWKGNKYFIFKWVCSWQIYLSVGWAACVIKTAFRSVRRPDYICEQDSAV